MKQNSADLGHSERSKSHIVCRFIIQCGGIKQSKLKNVNDLVYCPKMLHYMSQKFNGNGPVPFIYG